MISRKSDGLVFTEYCEDFTGDSNLLSIIKSKTEVIKKFKDKKGDFTFNFDTNDYVAHCKVNENILNLIITKKNYNQKLAFCLLNDINKLFIEEVKKIYGMKVDIYSKLETLERENYFNKFEKTIKELNFNYENQESKDNIDKIKKDLYDVHQIMNENVNLIIKREDILSSVSNMSSTMKDESKNLYGQAKKTRYQLMLRKYSIVIALILIVLVFIFLKIYL